MAKPIGTRDSAMALSEIIDSAKSTIVLVTPYVQLSYTHKRKLHDASELGKQILLVCRKEELYPNQKEELERMRNVKLLDHPNVHAKCYFNESKLLITSLNFYDHSIKNNVELGTWFDNSESQEKFSIALSDAISALNIAELNLELAKIFGKQPVAKNFNRKSFETAYSLFAFQPLPDLRGKCIHCSKELQYLHGSYPLCGECFVDWSREYNFTRPERFCHWCGEEKNTTKAKPLCYSCFTKYKLAVKELKNGKKEENSNANEHKSIAPENISRNTQSPSPETSSTSESSSSKMSGAKIIIVMLGGLALVAFTILWLLSKRDEEKVPVTDALKQTVKQYCKAWDQSPDSVVALFAPNVEYFVLQANMTPLEIRNQMKEGLADWQYRKSVVEDSSFYFSTDEQGRNAVSVWVKTECWVASKKQYLSFRNQEEFVIDADGKIVSLKELHTGEEQFSYEKPGKK